MAGPNPPRVGPASEDYRSVCQFAARPGAPQCQNAAETHICVEDDTYGLVALASCGQHRDIALQAAEVVDEHPHAGFCGLPATRWLFDPSMCVLDDSGEEPVLVGAKEASGGRT